MSPTGVTMSPPSELPDDRHHEPPQWPKVVGIVSICWASLGLLCSSCGLAMVAMMGAMTKGAEEQFGPMPDVLKPTGLQMAGLVLGYIPTILLLVAGIMTLTRKPAGRAAHLAYAAIGLVLGLFGSVVGILHQLDIDAWVRNNPTEKWAQQQNAAISWSILVFIVLLSLVWPIFCGIWFGAMKKRPEVGAPAPISI